MITVISPENFKTIPWKNGLGETTELAINEHGTLERFDWRLSIASVVEDGIFSDFSDYDRNLILIEGNGIRLTQDQSTTDNLIKKLDVASFAGACKTFGSLIDGGIKDFNIITNQKTMTPIVQCFTEQHKASVDIPLNTLCFAYSLSSSIEVESSANEKQHVPLGSLVKISHLPSEENQYWVSGKDLILVILKSKD
ncbi:MAG: HutD family protein [Colwellia sp.]